VTLLLTTHDLPDVERLCRRLVVIDQRRVLVDGDLDALRRRFGGARQLVVELVEPSAALDGLPGVLGVTVEAAGLRQRLAFAIADHRRLADHGGSEPSGGTRPDRGGAVHRGPRADLVRELISGARAAVMASTSCRAGSG
jgi:hypothetical protein